MTFYQRYGDYQYNVNTIRDSINREMYPSQSRRESSADSNHPNRKGIDWFDATLAGVSSGAALVALGAPHPYVKLGAEAVGISAAALSAGRSYYRFRQNEITGGQLAIALTLNLSPLAGERLAGKVGQAALGVLEHQIGTLEALKSIFYDPNK